MGNIKKYQMKYMFDWGSGTCLWSTNDAAIEKYDYPVDIKDLPISEDLRNYLDYLIVKHDEALNWDDPADDLLWTEEQQKIFAQKALKGYERLCDELKNEYEIALFHSMI